MFKRGIVMMAAAAGFVLGAAVTAMYTSVRAEAVQQFDGAGLINGAST